MHQKHSLAKLILTNKENNKSQNKWMSKKISSQQILCTCVCKIQTSQCNLKRLSSIKWQIRQRFCTTTQFFIIKQPQHGWKTSAWKGHFIKVIIIQQLHDPWLWNINSLFVQKKTPQVFQGELTPCVKSMRATSNINFGWATVFTSSVSRWAHTLCKIHESNINIGWATVFDT
jgi:hypothetical protein